MKSLFVVKRIMSIFGQEDGEDFPGRLLHQAALWDNAELMEDLLHADHVKHINSIDAWGRTPLHAAGMTEGSSCLRILLQSGADPNVPCGPRGEYRTVLHTCAENGYISNVRLLLEHDARTDCRDALGFTALDLAVKGGHSDCVALLQAAQAAQEAALHEVFSTLLEGCARGDVELVTNLLRENKHDVSSVINMAPSGSNTLLFKACENGCKDLVQLLIDHGADARVHPVTKYSPLYIACYNGRKDIAELLLKKFPELVKVATVEKWLPAHACCIQGHYNVLDLLLKFPYPLHVLQKYKDKTGRLEYDLPFDINFKDVSGQTILYVATCTGNQKMVELLLKHKVKARLLNGSEETAANVAIPQQPVEEKIGISGSKRRISEGIQALMSRLNVSLRSENSSPVPAANFVTPVEVDVYCNHGTQTALHVAVRNKHHGIAGLLLTAGANPNLTLYFSEEETSRFRMRSALDDQYVFTGSTALVEAVRHRDMGMIDLLLKHGARDTECKALYVAVQAKDDVVVSKLLALKAHLDPENKISKKAGSPTATLSVAFPSNAVMINWHGQQCLEYVRPQWLIDAAVALNPKLKLSPRAQPVALHAITRIDISNNVLVELPEAIFQLHSLRSLNAAQNKIESLPKEKSSYSCVLLEELQLQDNRIEVLPVLLFTLPALTVLDVSNNKLQFLPKEMWTAPKLKELNASFNLLKDLPDFAGRPSSSSSAGRSSDTGIDLDLSGELNVVPAMLQAHNSSFSEDESLDDARAMRSSHFASINIKEQELIHHSLWSRALDISESLAVDWESSSHPYSQLVHLNLAHNSFTAVPPSLACLAVSLTRLNLSFNSIADMGTLCSYPVSLKQLDLSHNQIEYWPSSHSWEILEPVEPPSPSPSNTSTSSAASSVPSCYAPAEVNRSIMKTPVTTARKFHAKTVRASLCAHRRHTRLENVRTLTLADNLLSSIQLWQEEEAAGANDDDEEGSASHKGRLLFPSLSALDLSNNRIKEIPKEIHEFGNLSVLNLSGNQDVTELPPEMGLLAKLWNLNTRGCNLQEPLRSMIESKKYKTMDVIGYLKSVLEDAKPYARMKLMLVGVQGIGKTSLLEQLRHEGGGSYKKKPPEHWAKRMGNKNINTKTSKGINMSTVGVDINDWIYEKKEKVQNFGPVTFRTWDFAGQREYYATHQYFLSKRSLYLVVWRITDGEQAMDDIFQWLVNIQARAPNSPVVIVGTHYDLIKDNFRPSYCEDLQQMIRDRFINVVDAEKCGLPRVMDTIEVSCKTRYNIRRLCNLIYDTVFSLRLPGSKERLLEQRIPATYLALEDVVSILAQDQKNNGRDPVLPVEQYRMGVSHIMHTRFRKSFRDTAELNQATAFLHENGVILHYEDATLKDLYFLDPQWLCDMLAHVVTIREINPFAKNGLMRMEDLKLVFRSSASAPADAQTYVVSLLNKFEVALTWDSRTLLIPSLLPSEDLVRHEIPGSDVRVKIPVRSRGRAIRPKKISSLTTNFVLNSPVVKQRPGSAQPVGTESIAKPLSFTGDSADLSAESPTSPLDQSCEISFRSDPETSIYRLLLLSYIPTGFWSRLMTRILAEDGIVDVLRTYFNIPRHVASSTDLTQSLEWKAEFRCWQTGLELFYLGTTLLRIKEVLVRSTSVPFEYRNLKFIAKQEGSWLEVDVTNCAILEIWLPNETIVIRKSFVDNTDFSRGYQTFVLEPCVQSITKLLALATDHIDTLLEDWYPSLGTRFVHTSEGKYLVTRLIPCPRCLCASGTPNLNFQPPSPAHKRKEERGSRSSALSDGADSGVGHESPNSSSRTASVEGHPDLQNALNTSAIFRFGLVYSFTMEECILLAHSQRYVQCPLHGDIHLAQVAPDTIFLDLGERHVIHSDQLKRGKMLGRGAFGFVYRATCQLRGASELLSDVAIKMLQPVDPGPDARTSAVAAYKAAISQWERDPLRFACKAYCTARQELTILLTVRHPHIVPFVGICVQPLSLILQLAPLGALDDNLKHYRRSGARLSLSTLQQIILQIAKALEYLHQQHIIYRDLKSENVLVWALPPPGSNIVDTRVDVKLADYGISRLSLPTGTKGFGGTEGFMAPEIMRYNGEEEYTDKVDCFSFGMFMYELLTLRQPFEGQESVKEYVLEGGRPSLTPRDTVYPMYLLDLMVLCWSQHPKDRPTASQIVSIATAPEFTRLQDAVSLNHQGFVTCSVAVPLESDPNGSQAGQEFYELWTCSTACQVDLLLASAQPVQLAAGCGAWLDYYSIQGGMEQPVTAACLVEDIVWLGDAKGQLHAFSSRSYQCIFRYSLEPDAPNPASVRCLIYLVTLRRVAVALSNGRLFLCRSDFIPASPTHGEGTFVMTELGLGGAEGPLHCMTAVNQRGVCELWCGQSEGSICIFVLKEGVVTGQSVVNHYDPPIASLEVLQLVATDHLEVEASRLWSDGEESAEENTSGPVVWSYVYPGCVVYRWDPISRRILHRLDCSKLAPCSESLQSISIEEHLSPGRCQVTSLGLQGKELYIGTQWGCIVVVEASSLRPITVFRPYEEDVRLIVPLRRPASTTDGLDPEQEFLVTVGKGYRKLLSRYVAPSNSSLLARSSSSSSVDSNSRRSNSMQVLLWRAGNWN